MVTAEELGEDWDGPLPDALRQRVVSMASETLGSLSDDEVPASLRPFHRWAPGRRTKLAATPLASAVEHDVVFRQRAAAKASERSPDLAAALESGTVPAAADPVDVAALAYLARTPGWPTLVAAAETHLDRARVAADSAQSVQEVARLSRELELAQERAREEIARLREEIAHARADAEAVRRQLREEKGARRKAERQAVEDAAVSASARAEADSVASGAEAELRRMRGKLAEAEAAAEAARRSTREGRGLEDARLRLLLDTVVDAAAGLRRELALPPATVRPGDLVEAASPVPEAAQRLLPEDDPAQLDQLLALPQVHVIIDGYNVTKTGYPDLPLDRQRARLVGGLAALKARSGAAEVTCCFDGATVAGRVPSMSGRGVRVLFSRPGEIADELIRRLVAAEPEGRPVVVVSSDREVADGVRRLGARPVSAAALVRRLDRG